MPNRHSVTLFISLLLILDLCSSSIVLSHNQQQQYRSGPGILKLQSVGKLISALHRHVQVPAEEAGHEFIFIGGLHHSGTSLIHYLLASHPQASGFHNTGKAMDEGMHLQDVFPNGVQARAINKIAPRGQEMWPHTDFRTWSKDCMNWFWLEGAYLDDESPLVTAENAKRLWNSWKDYWDLSKRFLLEKSPPNLVKAPFLQAVFPNSRFLFIIKHPLSRYIGNCRGPRRGGHMTVLRESLEHFLFTNTVARKHVQSLNHAAIFRFEDFLERPVGAWRQLVRLFGMDDAPMPFSVTLEQDEETSFGYHPSASGNTINQSQRTDWIAEWFVFFHEYEHAGQLRSLLNEYEERMRVFGYSLFPPYFSNHSLFSFFEPARDQRSEFQAF